MPRKKADEKLSVRETAELLGVSVKATQEALARGVFANVERDTNPETGRTLRVWIPRSSVLDYAKKRRIELRDPRSSGGSPSPAVRRVLEGLQREILDLRLRLAEAEQEIARLRGERPSE